MSYPRNAASPPHFLVGYVYDSTTNALQTSGVSARVKTGTGAWGAAAGTLECDTTSGAWTYTPTQGETNSEAFSVSLYKANCSGVGMTVITGKSPTAGYVAPDWGQVLNPSSTVSLSGTTIKAVTDGVSLGSAVITSGSFASGAITAASIAASALNGKGDWQTVIWSSASATVNLSGTTVKAVTDAVALPSSASINITGNITGNLTGSVGSVTGAVGSVTGNVGGSVASVTGAVGSVTGNVGGNVTGSVGSVATGGITSSSFAAGAVTANAIAAAALNGKGDWQTVIWTSASATVNLSGTTIKAVTDAVTLPSSASINITGNITGNLSGSVGSVTGAVGSVSGNVGGNVTGSVNSVATTVSANVVQWNSGSLPTFPTNFGSLLINSSGHLSRVTLVDTTTTNSDMRGTDGAALATVWTATVAARIDMPLSDIPTAGENADAVWDEVMSGHTTAGTYGGRIPRSDSSNVNVKITGSSHIAADIHELQPAVIEAQHFALGAIDANALAADASSEIATAVRTELATELARIDVTVGSRLATIAYTAPPTATTIADTTLGRSVSNVEATAAEHSICTLVLAALESSVIGTSWTIKRTDGTTTHATKTVTTDASAEPITGVT